MSGDADYDPWSDLPTGLDADGGTGGGATSGGDGGGAGFVVNCTGAAGTTGANGTGPARSATSLGAGGAGGSSQALGTCTGDESVWTGENEGEGAGGGGGGYFGGGGGGGGFAGGGGGGGGSGFAAATVVDAQSGTAPSDQSSQNNELPANGLVTLSFVPNSVSVSIADAAPVYEPASGAADADFTVSLSQATTAPVSVHYETKDGTGSNAAATADDDYSATSGTATFAAGKTSTTISVPVDRGDGRSDTATKVFTVSLSDPSGAVLDPAASAATGTIDLPRVYGQLTTGAETPVGIPDADVKLRGTADTGRSVARTATSDASGDYQFHLDPGTYTVTPQPPSGHADDRFVPGDCDGTSATDQSTGLSHCTLDLGGTGHENEEASFTVPEPKLEALVGGSKVECVATEIQDRFLVALPEGSCDNPALLDTDVEVKGSGFAPDHKVVLLWLLSDETDPSSLFKEGESPFQTITVQAGGKGAFTTEISAKWLDGTCSTRLFATQGDSKADVVIGFRPQAWATGSFRLPGEDFQGGFLCADTDGTFWPSVVEGSVGSGQWAVAQEIPDPLIEGSSVDGANTTGPSEFYIVSKSSPGRRVVCDGCRIDARSLEVETPNGGYFTLKSSGFYLGGKVWSFGGAPESRSEKISGCSQYPTPGPVTMTRHLNASGCVQFGNSVEYQLGLDLAYGTTITANGPINVDHSGIYGQLNSNSLVNSYGAGLTVKGGLRIGNVSLGAGDAVKLGY